jgi:hypothetical protein
VSQAVVDYANCTNCGAALHGGYCGDCGQKATPLNPTIGHFLHDLLHEILHVDGKIFRSFRLLLTKPGFLTLELFHGRRAAYVAPIRLYLVFSVAAFAVLAMMPREQEIVTAEDVREIRENGLSISSDGPNFSIENLTAEERRKLGDEIVHMIPRVMFVLVPVCALLIMLRARQSGRNYPQHLYFALHVHAAYFALLALMTPLELVHDAFDGLGPLIRVVYILIYSSIAFRRVYGYSRFRSAVRVLTVFVAYMTIVGMAFIGVVIAAYYITRT